MSDKIKELLKDPKDRQSAIAAANAWKSSTLSWVSKGTRLMAEVFLILNEELPTARGKKGIHGRNALDWPEGDFQMLQINKLEAIKLLSNTHLGVYDRLKRDFPEMVIISRLYDDHFQNTYFNNHRYPTPEEYAIVMISRMSYLKGICELFEVHNEPNHPGLYEGWGVTDEEAKSFDKWFLEVYDRIKNKLPWAKLGFPGLAVPHRDLEWLDICWQSIQKSDWLGCHCYWQTPAQAPNNHLSTEWGLRFIKYHDKYQDKNIHVTECGNSNAQSNIPLSNDDLNRQIKEYYEESLSRDYIKSVSFFIASSPDKAWSSFAWRKESGEIVVRL